MEKQDMENNDPMRGVSLDGIVTDDEAVAAAAAELPDAAARLSGFPVGAEPEHGGASEMPTTMQMVLRADGFRELNGTWSRQNLCSAGLREMTLRVATEDDLAEADSHSVLPPDGPVVYACRVGVPGGPMSRPMLRDEDGTLHLAAIFLAA